MGKKWHHRESGRCGHAYCTDCAKRRGSNRGNRRLRYAARRLIRSGDPDGTRRGNRPWGMGPTQ